MRLSGEVRSPTHRASGRTDRQPERHGERARRELDTLAAMADDLAGQFALQPLLERILRHSLDLLGSDSGSICTVDEIAGTYRKEVDLGVGCHSGKSFPLDEGVTGEVVRARQSVIFDDYADVRGGHIADADRAGLHGVIGVPIRWRGSIIGTCVVFNRDAARTFTDADLSLLETFATHAAIAITNARLHTLAADRASEAAMMAERERLIREVHDSVARGLAAVLLQLESADRATDPRRALESARGEARSALAELQRAVLGLGPALLDGRSVTEAVALELRWLESTASLDTDLVVVGQPELASPELGRQIFRIVQESLTNVLEHARARKVRVGLVFGVEAVTALVEDDGRGFDVAAVNGRASRGLGLRGLVARADHLGGTVQIESTPQWGTKVRAELPYFTGASADDSRTRWRVLVVHESAVVRAGLVRMLGAIEPDIQVVGEVAESSQAIEAYQLLRPHVVLAHLDLPHLDGVSLISHLRACDPSAAVVLLIDSVSDDRLRGAAQVGAVGFVERDAPAAGLARAIVAAARGDSLIKSAFLTRFTAAPNDSRSSHPLTSREREVRTLVEQGLPDKQIATHLQISVKTVEKHVGAVLRKTGAANRTVLAGLSAAQR